MKRIAFLTVIFASTIITVWCTTTDNTEQKVALAQCLTEKWATMYGTTRCSHCNAQKESFGYEAFAKINFVDCDKNKNTCGLAGVEWYPTRVFADKSKLVEEQKLEALAQAAGCEYATVTTGSLWSGK